MGDAMLQAPVALVDLELDAKTQAARFRQDGKPVRVLHLWVACRKAEDIAHQASVQPGPANEAAFGLDHEHQIGRVGLVAFTPDLALQVLGGAEFGHVMQVAEGDAAHARKSRVERVAVAR